jgi:hypothetical protein
MAQPVSQPAVYADGLTTFRGNLSVPYKSTLRNIPEEPSSYLRCGGSPKSWIFVVFVVVVEKIFRIGNDDVQKICSVNWRIIYECLMAALQIRSTYVIEW